MSKDLTKLPYFEFIPNSYLQGDITLEDLDVQGLFMNICCWYWVNDCSLALARLKRRLSRAYGNIDEALQKLLDAGVIEAKEDGSIAIEFLDEQYNYAKERRQKNAENGRKGGKAKAINKGNSSDPKAPLKQNSSEALANPSQPSESEREKESEKEKERRCDEGAQAHQPSSTSSPSIFDPLINEPTSDDVIQEAVKIGYPMKTETAQRFLNHYGAMGWIHKGSRIRDWRKKLPAWKANESRPGGTHAGKQDFDKQPVPADGGFGT